MTTSADLDSASLTRTLTELLRRPVSADDRARAALHVLDWAGCAIAGRATPAGRSLAAHAAAGGNGPCAAVGLGSRRLPVAAAAFFNGGLGNALEMDDIHRTAILHPGPVVIPAALAAAEVSGAAPAEFLDAVVRGYEAVIRVGESVGPGHYRLWHNTSTCGPFGAAAAVAGLLHLTDAQTGWALGNAGTQASGPWRCRHEDVMSKQLHTARAAHAGVVAAELAAAGFTGPARILEGAQGFYDATCPDPDPTVVTADPEAAWKVWQTSFKPWPACRHAHAVIDAALALRDRVGIADIAALRIQTYRDAALFCDRPEPHTELEAKFSLQHAAAVALLDGPPPLAAFAPTTILRSDVAALRGVASVTVTARFADAYPRHYGSAVVAVLADGSEIVSHVADALGDPENPVDEARIVGKARELCTAGGLSGSQAMAVIEAALDLPRVGEHAGVARFAAALTEHGDEGAA